MLLTSADPLFLTGEDSWCVDDTDTFQHSIGQLGTYKPAQMVRRRLW